MSGRVYADEVTVGVQDVVPVYVIIRPSLAADDPKTGRYRTWAAAHPVILAVDAPARVIYIDSPGVVVSIPSGTWDMTRISIIGFPTAGTPTAQQQITTAVGAVFTNWTEGCDNCILSHLGTSPLYTVTVNTPNALRMRTGKNSTWQSDGNTAPIVSMTGTGAIFVNVEAGTAIVGDGATQYEVFQVAAGGTIALFLFDNTTLTTGSLRGVAGTFELWFVGIGPALTTQAAFGGTLNLFKGAGSLQFTVGNGAYWTDPDPTVLSTAVNRIAQALSGLLAGPIP